MFGIGLEELLLFLFIVFLISPKDIPKVMRKIGSFINEINRLKQEVLELRKDIEDIAKEARLPDELDFSDDLDFNKKNASHDEKTNERNNR